LPKHRFSFDYGLHLWTKRTLYFYDSHRFIIQRTELS